MATLVPTVGKAIISGRMFGATPTQAEPKYVAWGTGAGTTAAADTTLFTEASEARVAGTGSQFTVTNTNDAHRVQGTITAAGAKTITNAGVFDASTAGVLYVKGDFTGLPLSINDSVAFDFRVQFT